MVLLAVSREKLGRPSAAAFDGQTGNRRCRFKANGEEGDFFCRMLLGIVYGIERGIDDFDAGTAAARIGKAAVRTARARGRQT